jgi:hypothetical protein
METSMSKLHTTLMAGIAVVLALDGCAPTGQHPPGVHKQGTQTRGDGTGSTSNSPPKDGQYPTKLENCLTAVGADRTRCSAKN